MNRLNVLDLLRFIGAFFIMSLHTSLGDLNYSIQQDIRLSARWAVPFFFCTTGYFVGKKITSQNLLSFSSIQLNIIKLISVFFIANLIYSPINFFQGSEELSIESLLIGTYSHLWFIGSMIFGYIIIWFFYFINKSKCLFYISFFLLILALIANSYDVLFGIDLNYDLFRFLLSIPFMNIGIWFSKKEFNRNSTVIFVTFLFLGFALQYIESNLFYRFYKHSIFDQQLLIGTVIFTISLFVLSIILPIRDNIFSTMGRKYSLFIYLYHPLVYLVMGFLIVKLIPENLNTVLKFFPLIGFILTLILGVFLDKYFKIIYKLLNGDFIDR